MKNIFEKQNIWKGVEFWKGEIKNSGQMENLPFFNDVITEKSPPYPDAGYGEPMIEDVLLDNKKCDVYHTDHAGGTWHRVFIHIKEDDSSKE